MYVSAGARRAHIAATPGERCPRAHGRTRGEARSRPRVVTLHRSGSRAADSRTHGSDRSRDCSLLIPE